MGASTRANPNCANASNPYHQCTQACLHQKTKQTSKPHANNNTSGYGTSVTDGDLAKKVYKERRTYAGCPKASNPYHQCDDNCHRRLSGASGGGATPLKYESERKVLGSKAEPPVLENVPKPKASNSGAIYLSDAPLPTPHASDKNKKEVVEPAADSSDHITLEPHSGSGEIHHPLQDAKPQPVSHKHQQNEEDKVPITNADDDTGVGGEGLTLTTSAADSSFSGFPQSQSNEDSDQGSESRVPVGGYHVKESFAPILRSILDKYGDIAATCHLESLVVRSYYIECVCFVVQELQSATVMHLTKFKLKELLAILKDVESAQLRVAWLRTVLDEIAENIEIIHQNQDVEAAKANSDRQVESLREELESQLETLAQKEQEVADIKTRIPEVRDRLSELELKSSQLDKSMLSIKSMVDNLHSKSFIDELL